MKLYNTLSRKIETVTPLKDRHINMYTCGLTVYSQPQIGNWVAYIYSDVLVRTLLKSGYTVTRVQNITDVGHLVSDDDTGEDKMEKGARAEGKSAWEIAEKYIAIADREAYDWLGLIRPDRIVRATDLIAEQIEFTRQLEKKGFTYIIPEEGLYFDTSKLSDYGKLARLDIAGLKAGARVDVAGKKHPTDFALWKFSPKNSKRDMEWESPWGVGFPGWHLECSVIAREALGDQIDIHTGGIDHIPVHHTNEIAQTESLTGKPFVKYWFHNNHIKINGTKMSKSTGNSYSLSDLKDRGYNFNSFKLMVLSSHYRTEGNFTWKILDASQNRYKHWQSALDKIWQTNDAESDSLTEALASQKDQIYTCLQDDLDTPAAIAAIDSAVTLILQQETLSTSESAAVSGLFREVTNLLGIAFEESDIDISSKGLIEARLQARADKNYALSDELRKELASRGIGVNDTAGGSTWYRI